MPLISTKGHHDHPLGFLWSKLGTWSQGTTEYFLVWKILFGKVHRNLDFLSSNYITMPQVPAGCAQRINGPTRLIYFLGSQGLLP